MGAMRVRKQRSSESEEVDDDELAASAVVLTSSDDEEANRDLSLEIVERARKRGEAKVSALERDDGAVLGAVESVKKKRKEKTKGSRRKGKVEAEEEEEGKEKKRKKRRRKKEKCQESGDEGKVEQDCFVCKRRGHIAKDCPDKHQKGSRNSKICLQCGDLGHDMWSCSNTYSPEDLQDIQCYACKKFGHICCVDYHDMTPIEVSCYNCGQCGHSGVGCGTQRWQREVIVESASLCYVCGEEGHFARACTKNQKPNQWSDETSTPFRKSEKSRSAPHHLGKPYKRKNTQHDWATDDSFNSWSKRFEVIGQHKSSPTSVRKSSKSTTTASAYNSVLKSFHNKHKSITKMPASLDFAGHQ